jgi:hypothetical protein
MLNSKSIQGIIVLVLGIFIAIWLGLSIVTNQTDTILQIVAAIAFIVCIALGRRIWLIIPFATTFALSMRIPGQPDAFLLAQVALIAFSIPQFLMRKLPWRLQYTELEFWMLIMTLMIAQVYIRNPVGLNVFGGSSVGGRAYILYAIALASALILCGLRVPASDLKWVLRLSIVGGLLNLAISIVGILVPTIGFYIGQSFTMSDEVNYENREAIDTQRAGRIGFLTNFSNNLALWISCYISPLVALVKPLWLILILVAAAASLMGGFRNGLVALGLTFLLGIAYRSGGIGLLLSSFVGMGGIALMAAINLFAPLPPNVQRTLTFLPGTWEQRYKEDAEASTDWRVEIWKEVLLTDRWIQNKWLGDGMGFSAAELASNMDVRKGVRAGISGFDAHRDYIIANGDYHSGPVSAIRTIGYIGLLIMALAQIRLAVHAHRQIMRCRGTEWFPVALLICIPIIWAPAFFWLIFGGIAKDAPAILISAAFLRLLQENLPLPAYIPQRRRPYVLPSRNATAA